MFLRTVLQLLASAVLLAWGLLAQSPAPAVIEGRVTFAGNGEPLRGASVVLTPGGKIVESDAEGRYRFQGLAPGEYTLVAHVHALTDEKKTVRVQAGGTATVDFALGISPLKESITVTASGREESTADALLSVVSLDGYQLTGRSASPSLGDLIGDEAGVARRSYGPGTTRPVIRGFDGDRVLVLQDGMRTGTVSSQSGDHGEPIDPNDLERVEVVKGPATLLYGSNAIGGVVNVLTDHHVINQHPHQGLHMALTGVGGTANAQGGGSGSFEYGYGNWLVYGSGGGMRTGDYNTPIGRVLNSFTDMITAKAGLGHYGERLSWNAVVQRIETTYGIPTGVDSMNSPGSQAGDGGSTEPESSLLDMRRTNVRLNGAWKKIHPAFEQFQFDVGYSDYTHREIEGAVTGTQFFNKQFVYSGIFDQRPRGRWSGRFGLWGLQRDYKTRGAEILAPPVDQSAFALFGLEEFRWERVRLQFGGRWETNHYTPDGLRERRFSGLSASTGAWLPLWANGALVANYIHSYRAPALEELYNYGPHPGNLAFEIGNPDLKREAGDGVEISVRHQGHNLRGEANLFRYQMHDFVYFQPTGGIEDALPVYLYSQADARFLGAEARAQLRLHGPLWLLAGFDYVDANLTAGGRMNLPRIPPARGRLGLDWFWKGLSVRPELLLVNRQWQVAPNEDPTAGYTVFNLNASYTLTRGHTLHTFNITTFNLGDRLYRNHLSFIKDIAPEMGRGVRVSYTMRLF
ncbi:MAG: TonB-dependent receptor [Bryobacteraceae bacterium]